ncbi:MAG: hypothetical protein M1830_006790, partial [Pleopsidium flavum]
RELARAERSNNKIVPDENPATEIDAIDGHTTASLHEGDENSIGELDVYSPMPMNEEILSA